MYGPDDKADWHADYYGEQKPIDADTAMMIVWTHALSYWVPRVLIFLIGVCALPLILKNVFHWSL
jgi:hypothetical protein